MKILKRLLFVICTGLIIVIGVTLIIFIGLPIYVFTGKNINEKLLDDPISYIDYKLE